ncbi:MAG: helix-turn-helix domain-containing protein [Bacteroidetes bacterium]|nr:helix-turn-helix domain-containing protein [Bacteroidota bacterium]
MNIKAIKTKKDYEEALKRLEEIFFAKPGTKDGDEAEVLGILIDNYEELHFPIDVPDPIEVIKLRMLEKGMNQNDLAEIIGHKTRVSEILNKKRKLNLDMIRNLHEKLNISYETLLKEYKLNI